MSDPYRKVSGSTYTPYTPATYDKFDPRPTRPGSQSAVLKRFNIESGQTVSITSKDVDFYFSPWFEPIDLIYVGSPELWILKGSNIGGVSLFPGFDIPCETFSPGCPSGIDWPTLGHQGTSGMLNLVIKNRGEKVGHFIARLAGDYRHV